MTVGPRWQCGACVHLDQPSSDAFWSTSKPKPTCNAFPTGIPEAVLGNELDHRQPIDGDHGIQFEAKPGDEFPEYALQ